VARKPSTPMAELTIEQVLAWLEENPDIVAEHADALGELLPPQTDLGGNVIGLQGVMVERLQKQVKDLRSETESLVTASRDNHSVQAQVHQAALALAATRNLEQLVDVLTADLVQRFGVDVVRLGLESPVADAYEVQYHEQNYSGICFLPLGSTDAMIGNNRRARLITDTRKTSVEGFEAIFAECSGIVRSCALLRLQLPKTKRYGVLAFGVKETGHFHPRQGTELLIFLARMLELKLDEGLRSSGIEELLE
jgi:uncharacterized protein YigA (DUF484 family)